MERHSDEELLALLRLGGEAAYREIFMSFYPLLTAFANKFVHDEATAKDVVQHVFINLFSVSRNDIQSLRSYLFTAVRNECLNHIRKERTLQRHQEQHAAERGELIDFQDAVEQAEAEARIYRAIQNLPTQCRRIFLMNRFEGKKNAEIAADLGLSVRTVETQISKALLILKKSLFKVLLLIK